MLLLKEVTISVSYVSPFFQKVAVFYDKSIRNKSLIALAVKVKVIVAFSVLFGKLIGTIKSVVQFYLHRAQKVLDVPRNTTLNNVSIYKTTNANLRFVGLPRGNAKVKLYNVVGQQVLHAVFDANGIKDLALPKLAKGAYIVQLETEAGKLTKKIILE